MASIGTSTVPPLTGLPAAPPLARAPQPPATQIEVGVSQQDRLGVRSDEQQQEVPQDPKSPAETQAEPKQQLLPPQAGPLKSESEGDDAPILIGGKQLEQVTDFDPQEAFEKQVEKIADLVARFEEVLQSLDEFVEFTEENQPGFGKSEQVATLLADRADELLEEIVSSAGSLFGTPAGDAPFEEVPPGLVAAKNPLTNNDPLDVVL